MGLLAGEKRKQKIGLDPNNLTWAKDTSSVGQAMLKKMGWKEGVGLGANEDGRVVPVKASMKSNSAGLGCSAQLADSWIAHGEEFDQILASLNASTGAKKSVGDEKSPAEEMEGQRRFYGKFSRGGVKRTRTAEDLNCIFGRRKAPTHTQGDSKEETVYEKSNDSSEDRDESQDSNVDKSHGVETVTSSYSVQDYFAQKLKKLKQKKEDVEDVKELEATVDDKEDAETEAQSFNSYVTSSFSVNDYFSQKMKMRNEKLAAADLAEYKEGDCEKEDSLSLNHSNAEGTHHSGEELSQTDIKLKKKKKKKRKSEDVEITYDENSNSSVSCTEEKTKKKKKKKRKHEDVENEDVSSSIVAFTEDKTEKKKRKLEDDSNAAGSTIMAFGDAKTEKKKKKRNAESDELRNDDSTLDVNNGIEENLEKKKKKKKRKTEDVQISDDDSTLVDSASVLCTDENIRKKKKKKRKCEK